MAAVRREAQRRGVDVADVVEEAVQRFVVGNDLRDLLADFRRRDSESGDALNEDDALRLADEELRAVREARS